MGWHSHLLSSVHFSLFYLDSMTVTSEGSAIEARIDLLKKRLQAQQTEMKKVTNERNRKRKERLRIQEEQLTKQLEVRVVLDMW